MKARWVNQQPKTLVVIFETGDEVMEGLKQAAKEHRLSASGFEAIGAFEAVTLGFFDWNTKRYKETALHEQLEVLSLIGDVALKDGTRAVHAHVVVGRQDATTAGGHLIEGRVRPTLEVVLTEAPAHLRREYDSETGLALINLDRVS